MFFIQFAHKTGAPSNDSAPVINIDYAIETGPTKPVGGMGRVLEVLSRLK